MNATVILADDERLIRQSLVGLLETNGYDVRAGKNGEEALRRGAGDVVALRERDVALLRWFAGHPGEVFTRDFLFAKFWDAKSLLIKFIRQWRFPALLCLRSLTPFQTWCPSLWRQTRQQ